MIGSESTKDVSAKQNFKERVGAFESAISTTVDFQTVRKLAFGGIPESPGLRSIYWKVLLSYLPRERNQWNEVLKKNRQIYKDWIEELIIDPRKNSGEDDHPLSMSNSSQWHAFFRDKEILEEIDKDVKRTLPGLHFFNHDKQAGDTLHYEALKRILFMYAKLNPGIRYVQGMNEILGPLYYIFASDPDPDFRENAESDTFFCFTNVMSEIRDNFIKTLDRSPIGITGLMNKLNSLLRSKDPELWQDFENKTLNPQFYSFRWLTLLLSQEFELPDVLRLWDSLFADPVRFEFLLYVCCAMLVCLRENLLDGSFADNLKLLQSYPLQDIHCILRKAEEVQDENYQPPPPRPKIQVVQSIRQSTTTSFMHKLSTPARQQLPSEIKNQIEDSSQDASDLVPSLTPVTIDFPVVPKPFDEMDEEEAELKSHPLA